MASLMHSNSGSLMTKSIQFYYVGIRIIRNDFSAAVFNFFMRKGGNKNKVCTYRSYVMLLEK